MAKQKVDEYNLQLQNLRYEVLHLKKEVSRLVSQSLLLPYTYTYTLDKIYLKVIIGRNLSKLTKEIHLCRITHEGGGKEGK